MNQMRQLFNDKKYMAENFTADMSYQDFAKAYAARGEMLANLANGKANAYIGKAKPSRAEVRARRGAKK